MSEEELIGQMRDYFDEKIFTNHMIKTLKDNSRLKSYKINPIVSKYLSKVLEGSYNAEGFTKALYYPRVLGTSINTSFGDRIQRMFVELNLADGAKGEGLDITFIDKVDGEEKWCQLKAGPNTINSDDVNPLLNKFDKFVRRSRGNNAFEGLSNNNLVLGVLYGEHDELSQHYLKIDESYPVIIGKEFWYRITGFENFYEKLVTEIDNLIDGFNDQGFFEKGYHKLLEDVKKSGLF